MVSIPITDFTQEYGRNNPDTGCKYEDQADVFMVLDVPNRKRQGYVYETG